jgi:hypothetical protein
MSLIDEQGLRLSASAWAGGRFPTMEQYRSVLARGRMLYTLDLVGADAAGPIGPAVAGRPCNILYHNGGSGFSRPRPGGFGTPGMGRNEWLLDGVAEQQQYIRSLHERGIAVLTYQSDNNFDRTVFSDAEVAAMNAELDPFAWAFGTQGRTFACPNKPGWREYLAERLEVRVGRYGADGVFLDNSTPFLHCRCHTCRTLYAERFGSERDLFADMGRPETVVADMRVFDYAMGRAVPKNLARVEDRTYMRYLEWRIERIIDFYLDMRRRVQERVGRPVLWTTNGHIGIAEFTALNLAETTDMIFSEEGYSAPPVSNAFALRLGTAVGQGRRCMLVLTRVLESSPTADMVSVLSAEGRALGGQATFWDLHLRGDDRLAAAERMMREFFVEHAQDLFIPERDDNDTAVLMSYRSDLWTSQAISPARHVADLLEDLNQPYDVLLPERSHAEPSLDRYKLIIAPHTEILSDRWFTALQRYLDGGGSSGGSSGGGGALISTGNAATLREDLSPRAQRWQGARYQHLEPRAEKEFADARRPVGIHAEFAGPTGQLADAVRGALAEASVRIEPLQPLLGINCTRVGDDMAIHLVNRHVNLFSRIALRPRRDLTLRVRPTRPVDRVRWLAPGEPTMELDWSRGSDGIVHIELPPLPAYGIVRLYSRSGRPTVPSAPV